MSRYEKLGNYLLFEKLEDDKLSKSYLAGQFAGNQIQTICVVKKFDHSLSTLPDFILDVNQEAEILKQLANPNIIRPGSFVQDKSEFAAVFEHVDGKGLRTVLNKCVSDGFPFTVDHSLLVASRLCTALEYLHSKKANDQRLIHGYVCPEAIHVTYDGEIRLQYLGLARTLMKFPAGREKFFHDYKNYLAPEVLSSSKLDKSCDVFSAGVVLFEMLTGEALFAKGRNVNIAEAIEVGQMNTTSGERAPIPDDLKKLLNQALALEPGHRFGSIADMRKALDLLLFSSEFSPTTFNLAFFMHSLFRDTIDEENKNVAAYKKTDVSQHVKEEPPPPPKPEHPVGATPAQDIPAMPVSDPGGPSLGQPEIFGMGEEKEKSKMPLIIGLLVVVAAIAGIGYFAFKPSQPAQTAQTPAPGPTPAQPTLTPEQLQAQETEKLRLQEEAAKAQEEAKKKDEELKSLQAKLDQLLKLQEEAAKKAQPAASGSTPAPAAPTVDTEAIKKLQEEARRLEEEKKKQEELAEQKRKEADQAAAAQAEALKKQQEAAAAEAARAAATPPPATPQPATETPEETAPPAKQEVVEGQIVELTPDVVKPEILNRVNPSYPPIAQQKKIEGTVILSVLISERGEVVETKVLRGMQYGMDEAAADAIKKWKFRPAVKEGKRVRVWMTYPIVFKLQ